MNKVLITGSALGNESGVCDVCNYDFGWVFNYPSTFLWADKILISKAILDTIKSQQFPQNNEIAKSLDLIFDLAISENLIEIIDPTEYISPKTKDFIFSEIHDDYNLLINSYPEIVKAGKDKVPGQIFVNEYEYCSINLWAAYGALIIAKFSNANCLFDQRIFNYFNHLFNIQNFPKEGDVNKIEGFQKVFQSKVPNTNLFPEYVMYRFFNNNQCSECVNEASCRDNYLIDVEKNLKNIFQWRKYDEIVQIKNILDDISRRKHQEPGLVDYMDLVNEFKEKEKSIEIRLKSIFPKVNRWANVTTMVSIPIAFIGIATNEPSAIVLGAGIAGASQITKETIEYFKNKYSWVGFLNSS